MELEELRKKIDSIDDSLVELFCERMRVSADIGRLKALSGLEVRDLERERAKLADVAGKADESLREYIGALYSRILDLSCAYQEKLKQAAAATRTQQR